VRLRTPGSVREGQKGFEEEPFGIGKVGLVCFSHPRYPTERASQNPFSDSFFMLDFSHLRAEGVGMLLTHPFKVRRALDAPITCSLILAKKVAAL
jgi:hypothetical protein